MKACNVMITLAAFLTAGVAARFVMDVLEAAKPQCRKDREARYDLSERQIDKMILDSFPASDPPSTY